MLISQKFQFICYLDNRAKLPTEIFYIIFVRITLLGKPIDNDKLLRFHTYTE